MKRISEPIKVLLTEEPEDMMHYGWKYKTPKQFDDILLQSDGAYLTGLLFENSRDHIRQDKVQKREMLPVFKETVKWLDSYVSGRDRVLFPHTG